MVDALIGQKVGRYEIIERIGHGGMSEVFKACCSDDGSYVAIKLLHAYHADDPSFIHRFTREARAMSQLDHPSIVHVYDFDTKIQTPYIAMEYLGGGTLKQRFGELKRKGVILSLTNAVRIVLEIADALAYAHSRSMVHRDIKPANIIFNDEGRAVLTDFGIVKTLGATQHTTTGAMIGTPAYMSPEQGLGRAGDARSDVYALGVLFFQMVTGRLPYDADKPLAVVLKHINEPIPYPSAFNPDMPEELETIIMRALSKNPLERFQSAEDMTDAVRAVVKASDEDWALRIPQHLIVPASNTIAAARNQKKHITTTAATRRTHHDNDFYEQASSHRNSPRRLRAAGVLMSLVGILAIAFALLGAADVTGLTTPTRTTTVAVDPPTGEAELLVGEDDLLPSPVAITQSDPASASCDYGIQLENSYTTDAATRSAISGETFQMNWLLRNVGSCPLPQGTRFVYEAGEQFGGETELELGREVEPQGDIVLSTMLVAPGEPGVYSAAWRVIGADETPFGSEMLFEIEVEGIGVDSAETNTESIDNLPIAVDDTSNEPAPLDFNIFIQSCEFSDAGWGCNVYVVPSGGSGNNYTVRIDDRGQITEYTNVINQTYDIARPACEEWVQPVEVYDPATDSTRRKNVYFNPAFPPIASMISGQCSGVQE